MRKLLVLICLLAMPGASWAQSNPASWDNLKALQAGEKIRVAQTNSKTVSGPLVSVSDAAISVEGEGGPQTVQRHDVRSVKLAKHGHRLRNALIGGGIGAGSAAILGAAIDPPCKNADEFCFGPTQGQNAGIFAVLGFVIGGVIGALIPSHATIYRMH
jgi:hypothetical protein